MQGYNTVDEKYALSTLFYDYLFSNDPLNDVGGKGLCYIRFEEVVWNHSRKGRRETIPFD